MSDQRHATLYINDEPVGDVVAKRMGASWSHGDFSPNQAFAKFAPLASEIMQSSGLANRATGECRTQLLRLEQVLTPNPDHATGGRTQLRARYRAMSVRELAAYISDALVHTQRSDVQEQWRIVVKYIHWGEYSSAVGYLGNFITAARGECGVAMGVLAAKMGLDHEMTRLVEKTSVYMESRMAADGMHVVGVYPGSSAADAGLKRGDVIKSIEGKATAGMSPREANALLQGREETQVRLLVLGSDGNTRAVTVERETFLVQD